jgi:hypothetical protein
VKGADTLTQAVVAHAERARKQRGGALMNRRALCAALAGMAVLAPAAGAPAQTADDFPSRPIRIIVPQAAGSGVDLQARVLAQKMGELWGQQGVVDNRAGANAIIGMEAGANAKPDGYTLIYAPVSAVTTNAFIYKKLPYDTFRDFVPITQTTANPLGAVVNPSSGIKSIKDLVARAKANPGGINYGSFGIGNMTHLMGVLLSIAADIKMTHVPYRGQTRSPTWCQDRYRSHSPPRPAWRTWWKRASSICWPPSASSATSSSPTHRPWSSPAIRASSWWVGAGCSRPPACRRRSSAGCMAAWRRR